MNNYYEKYVKYKAKYLNLKEEGNFDLKTKAKYYKKINQKGGRFITNYNGINRFSTIEYPEMEEFLNPIYGCFLTESDFVRNNYFLYKAKIKLDELQLTDNFQNKRDTSIPSIIINDNLRQKIGRLTHNIGPIVVPNNEITMEPIDFGRFIAILYFAKMNTGLLRYEKNNLKCWFDNGQKSEKADVQKLQSYIIEARKVKDYIMVGTSDKMDFYLLLYFLWYKIQNDNDINEYYIGIQDVFNITNKYSYNIYNICPLTTLSRRSQILFEEAVIKTVTIDFIVFHQKSARPFCYDDINEKKYPDCGETTIRNLINLLCFDCETGNFDLKILINYNPIQELITYYTVFPNFDEQSSYNKKDIYGQKLNARDAWSYLIIYHANKNLTFNEYCYIDGYRNDYNVKANSKTLDKENINSLQLLNNLLANVSDWGDLANNDNIESIIPGLDEDGIGIIQIVHSIFGNIIIEYIDGHAFWHDIKNKNESNLKHLPMNKRIMINILNRKQGITSFNYLFYKYNENMRRLLNECQYNNDNKLYEILIQISLTEIINSEIRKNIVIDTTIVKIMKILKENQDKEEINDYIYKCNNFTFITEYIPKLKQIKSILNKTVRTIDLSPLSNITTIGNNFLHECYNLRTIDLTPLSNVTTIGDKFLFNCYNLGLDDDDDEDDGDQLKLSQFTLTSNNVNFSPLSNVTTIGNNFLGKCNNLTIIDLSLLTKITSIGSEFLYSCTNLDRIFLPPTLNISIIRAGFLGECDSLTKIDLTPLCNVTFIESQFLYNCQSLTEIDLTPLSNVVHIGESFMSYCNNLETIEIFFPHVIVIEEFCLYHCENLESIDLSSLVNLQSIGQYFLSECKQLLKIILTSLVNLESIGDYFLSECNQLLKINLTSLVNLESIGDNFLSGCSDLLHIDLTSLVNLKSIGRNFLSRCLHLTSISLGSLEKLELIKSFFLSGCQNFTLDLSLLKNLSSIGNNFLYNSSNINVIITKQQKDKLFKNYQPNRTIIFTYRENLHP